MVSAFYWISAIVVGGATVITNLVLFGTTDGAVNPPIFVFLGGNLIAVFSLGLGAVLAARARTGRFRSCHDYPAFLRYGLA